MQLHWDQMINVGCSLFPYFTQPKRIINWPDQFPDCFLLLERSGQSISSSDAEKRGKAEKRKMVYWEKLWGIVGWNALQRQQVWAGWGGRGKTVLITVVMVFEFGYALWFLRNIRVWVILKLLLAVGIYFLTATPFQDQTMSASGL